MQMQMQMIFFFFLIIIISFFFFFFLSSSMPTEMNVYELYENTKLFDHYYYVDEVEPI